jgi:hypothetical protein
MGFPDSGDGGGHGGGHGVRDASAGRAVVRA